MLKFLLDHILLILALVALAYLAIVHYHVIAKLEALEKTLLQKAEVEADVISGYIRTAINSVHTSLSSQVAAVPVKTVAAAAQLTISQSPVTTPTPVVAASLAAVELKSGVAGTAHSA